MKKTLEEQGYKVIAIQDECFFGTENGKEAVVVIVRLEKQGKKNPLVKYGVKEFPNTDYLHKWMTENNLEVAIPSEQFKATLVSKALQVIKATS